MLRSSPRSPRSRATSRACSAHERGDGYLHGDGYVVTWAIGHLVALAEPHEIRPQWKSWRRDLLPMLPATWPLVVGDEHKDQFEVVRKILTLAEVARVVCATDAGREGELIFRYIYEAARLRQAGAAPLDLVAHARSDSRRLRALKDGGSSIASPTPRAGAAAPTGSSG